MAALDAIGAFGNVFTNLLGLGLNESQNRRTNELDWKINQDNIFAAKEINESQLSAARENWKREQSNFEKQREWSIQDRAFENEYNSPYQQRLRYLRAGLNPALMMEGQNSVGSVNASTGQAPNFGSPPSMVPVENKFHYTPMDYSGLGIGMSNAINTYLAFARQDADISAIRQRTNNETLDTLSKISQRDWQNKEIKSTIDRMIYDLQFEKDNAEGRKDFISLTNKAIVADIAYKNMRTTMDEAMINSNIGLNKTQINNLRQGIIESMNRIYVSNESLKLSSAEVSQRIVSMINHDASVFENLGISKEMVSSQKFKNYVGTIVDAIANGAAIYFGARRALGTTPSKPYTPPLGDYIGW